MTRALDNLGVISMERGCARRRSRSTLLAYCFSVFITSPLEAFASAAIYQVVIVYIVACFLTFTYDFTVSLVSPACNILRAAFVSINLFSLLCKGSEAVGDITHFGGPTLYFILDGVLLFLFLVSIDSGSSWRHALSALLATKPRLHPSALSLAPLRPDAYADRMATALSGGNQRKLAIAIALMGDPSVILIDEFSTGIDARTKREMWGTLKRVCAGKAVVITTHSMEEAATLADKVGILARRMLAVGTLDALVDRYATYVVHFAGRSRADVVRAQAVMACIPGARMADDVATRFEVPVVAPAAAGGTAGERRGMSLAELFGVLAEAGAGEYAVEEASLESVFMKVIQENGAVEDERRARADGQRWWGMC